MIRILSGRGLVPGFGHSSWVSEGSYGRNQVQAPGAYKRGSIGTALYLQLVEDVVDVVLDRRQGQMQAPRNLFVREAVADETNNLKLPGGEVWLVDLRSRRCKRADSPK